MALDTGSPSTGATQLLDERIMFGFSHELRTYLRTVLTRVQLVQNSRTATLAEEDRVLLQDAAIAAGQIGELMSSMMAFVDVGQDGSPVSLSLMIRGLLLDRKPQLSAAGAAVTLLNSLDPAVPSALQAILKELLTNSIKFRDPERPLNVTIQTRISGDNLLEITVSDNGPGVGEPYLEKIFTPFHRLHGRGKFPGHGMGLPTARRIAATWGGEVGASPSPEGGLAVRVTVPVVSAESPSPV